MGHHRGLDGAAVVPSLFKGSSRPGEFISGHADPDSPRQRGRLPEGGNMAEAPSPGRFPPPYAGPSVWIRTIDSRGTILILFEFVEPGGYSVWEGMTGLESIMFF